MTDTPFRVVVLTCSELGLDTADFIDQLTGIDVVGVFWAPHPRAPFRRRLRRLLKNRGALGTARFLAGRMLRSWKPPASSARPTATAVGRVPVHHVNDFHDENCLRAMRELEPDLGVVDGTYILKESVFDLPRRGCINLHCGKVPEFRGTPPAFWELYHGVESVGVTIHRVAARLDAGPILAEESFPFGVQPEEDPMRYIDRYWRTVLRPNGIRMLGEVVIAIAHGTARERAQSAHPAPPNRTPTWKQVQELRRRLRERRGKVTTG
jgi:methionyl-tRNA formyltransferase